MIFMHQTMSNIIDVQLKLPMKSKRAKEPAFPLGMNPVALCLPRSQKTSTNAWQCLVSLAQTLKSYEICVRSLGTLGSLIHQLALLRNLYWKEWHQNGRWKRCTEPQPDFALHHCPAGIQIMEHSNQKNTCWILLEWSKHLSCQAVFPPHQDRQTEGPSS